MIVNSVAEPCPYVPYYYGSNIVYRDNMVYINNVPYVSAADYYQQARLLAQSADAVVQSNPQPIVINNVVQPEPQLAMNEPVNNRDDAKATQQTVAKPIAPSTEEWMPMGTFAFLEDDDKDNPEKILQLAANKKGQIRGNYVDEKTSEAKQLVGAVDPKTQRVAFHFVGDDKTVMECGLWNLTQDSVPILLHSGNDKTVQMSLVRLDKPDGEENADSVDRNPSVDEKNVAPEKPKADDGPFLFGPINGTPDNLAP